jgi:hypothetical protein
MISVGSRGCSEGSKRFSFEKRTKKLFRPAPGRIIWPVQAKESLFASFSSEKEDS